MECILQARDGVQVFVQIKLSIIHRNYLFPRHSNWSYCLLGVLVKCHLCFVCPYEWLISTESKQPIFLIGSVQSGSIPTLHLL